MKYYLTMIALLMGASAELTAQPTAADPDTEDGAQCEAGGTGDALCGGVALD
jgi:hypothetical protein